MSDSRVSRREGGGVKIVRITPAEAQRLEAKKILAPRRQGAKKSGDKRKEEARR
jgi:hypothetical protein